MHKNVDYDLASLHKSATERIQAGDFVGALQFLSRALALDPKQPDLNHAVGILMCRVGQPKAAVLPFSRAVLLKPDDTKMKTMLAELYDNLGDTTSAAAIRGLIPQETPARPGSLAPPPALSGSWAECAAYVQVGSGSVLASQSSCEVRYRPNPSGVCVTIGEETTFRGGVSILRRGASVSIGNRCLVDTAIFIAAAEIVVGNDVIIDWGVTLMDNDSHSTAWQERSDDVAQCGRDWIAHPTDFIRNKDWSNVRMSRITIGDRAWIGFNSSILKGVTIGEGAVVLPGSIVSSDVPPYTVVGGGPVTTLRTLERGGEVHGR